MDLHNRAADHEDVDASPDRVGLDLSARPGAGPTATAAHLDLDLDLDSRAAAAGSSAVAPAGRSASWAVTDRASDLLSLLARQARRAGGRPAILGTATLTWADVAERVEEAAGALAAGGVAVDDVVVLAADGPAARLVGLLAVAHLGAVALPAAPEALAERPDRLGPIPAAAVLTDAPDRLEAALGDAPLVALHRDGRPVEPSGAAVAPALRPSARSTRPLLAHPASVTALDGPAVSRRHGHLVAEGVAVARALCLDADDVVLAGAGLDSPLGLAFGVLVPLVTGAALLDPIVGDPSPASVVAAGPDWFAEAAVDGLDGGLERVRWCLTDDAVPREVAHAMTTRHGVTVRRAYGRPESGLVLADLGARSFHDPSAVGAGLPGVEVRLVDGAGRDCEPGAIGEIAVRARWLADAADVVPGSGGDARLVDGELRTGDHGCLDHGGDIVLVAGRLAVHDRVRSEADVVRVVLAEHPAVLDVEVTAITAPTGAQLLKAVVVAGERCDRRELLAWCRRHLPEPALPSLIEFRRELPTRAARPAAGAMVTTTLEVVPGSGPAPTAAPTSAPAVRPVDPLAARLTG